MHLKIFKKSSTTVGEWHCQLFFRSNNGQVSNAFKVPNKIYVLFNAWSKADDVYLPNEAERQEYVLNDVGRMYTGSTRSKEYRDWYYEQFNKGMLKAVMFIMGRSGLTPVERSDPVRTSRAISAMVNSIWSNHLSSANRSPEFIVKFTDFRISFADKLERRERRGGRQMEGALPSVRESVELAGFGRHHHEVLPRGRQSRYFLVYFLVPI